VSMDKTQLRELITLVLKHLDPTIPYSDNAVELLMLTCAQESHLGTYVKQIKGPAKGIFQMEPNTEKDIYENYLRYKPDLAMKIRGLSFDCPVPDDLHANLAYQIAMARIQYFRSPQTIGDNVTSWANLWKLCYNTPLGKGTTEEAMANYEKFC